MPKKVVFRLLSPLMTGGMRIADNFLESEMFIRGSVLRAAFANEILLECPCAEQPGNNGELNFIEEKDPGGKCAACPRREICRRFSDMRFSFAYPDDSFPAPFTAKACKVAELVHTMLDTVFQTGRLQCPDCRDGLKRMDSVKGLIYQTDSGFDKVRIIPVLTTHTAINYSTHTAEDGKLFTVKAIPKGTLYTAAIDDCGTDLIQKGKVIYAGKYASCGFGKMMIESVTEAAPVTEDDVRAQIEAFQTQLGAKGKATLLLMSDAFPAFPENFGILPQKEYLQIWQDAVFGKDINSVSIEKVFAETQLYSGYNTSRKWGSWRDSAPALMIRKGTSILLTIHDEKQAVTDLTALMHTGFGERTKDGYGAVAVCHLVHRLGVSQSEKH